MPHIKRLRTPITVMSGMIMAVALAGPANAADANYPPTGGTTVLGVSVTAKTPAAAPSGEVAVAGVSAGELAFTGSNAIRLAGLGGLLLVGGGIMVAAGKRRKVNA